MIRPPKSIQAISFDKASIGKRFKASKKRLTWKVTIENRNYTVEMYVSELSGKRKMMLDGEVKYSGKAMTGVFFQFPFKVGTHSLCVVQQDSEWDLKIDNVSFSRLHTNQRHQTTSGWGPEESPDCQWEAEKGPNDYPPSPHSKWNGTVDTTAEYPNSFDGRSRDSWARPALADLEPWEPRSDQKSTLPTASSPKHSPRSPQHWDYGQEAAQPRSIPRGRGGEGGWDQWEEKGREKGMVSLPARREKEKKPMGKPKPPIDLLDLDAESVSRPVQPSPSHAPVTDMRDDLSFLSSPAAAQQPQRLPGMPSTPSASRNPFLSPQPTPPPRLPIGAPGPVSNPLAAAFMMQSYMTGLMLMQQQRAQPKYY